MSKYARFSIQDLRIRGQSRKQQLEVRGENVFVIIKYNNNSPLKNKTIISNKKQKNNLKQKKRKAPKKFQKFA